MYRLHQFLILLLLPFSLFADGLTGHWQGTLEGEAFSISFNANGEGVMDGDPIRYQVMGNTLLIEVDGDLMSYSFTRQGNKLTVTGGDLMSPLVLTQGAKKAASQSTAQAPARPAAKTGGAELAGKWCLIKSFSAISGGGSQSSTCFELRADGSYVYESESSMSAYGGGMYAGTASSDSDAGTWQVSGNTLIAQSRSGQRNQYRLEKRNHPQNRDPMICLDGDCYVTYWQRAPW